MAQTKLFLKEKLIDSGRSIDAWTSLKWLLLSERLGDLYWVIRRHLVNNETFCYKDITIRKVNLNHYKHER
jgi:hypothetical protein